MIDKIINYNFNNKLDYQIKQDKNDSGLIDTIEINGSVAKLIKSRLDEIDFATGGIVTSSDVGATNLGNNIDGDFNTYSVLHHASVPDFLHIDLGTIISVKKIVLKHIFGNERKYKSVAIQISEDDITFTTLYNNNKITYGNLDIGINEEYIEEEKGLVLDINNLNGRYIKVFGFGSNFDFLQTEIREVEVYQGLFWDYGYLDTKEEMIMNDLHSVNVVLAETISVSGSQSIKYNPIVDNKVKYWSGIEWEETLLESFFESNTLSEINTNFSSLISNLKRSKVKWRVHLKSSDDGLSSPNIDNLIFSGQLEESYLPNKCKVYGYLTDIGLNINDENVDIKINLNNQNYINNNNIISTKEIHIKPENGYFEIELVPNISSLPIDKNYDISIKKENIIIFEDKIEVPNISSVNILDILV